MLALKLLTVPAFIALITLAARRWGAQVAGRLAGLPLVTGPILYFIDLEQGHAFAARAAAASVSAVTAAVAFGLAYAWTSRRHAWWTTLAVALGTWTLAASALAQGQPSLAIAATMTLGALWLAPRALPVATAVAADRPTQRGELLARMAAGAVLVGAVTTLASSVGSRWSGLLAMFPVLASVLCVFSHRSQGAALVADLLHGMAKGYYAFTAFCLTLALVLPRTGTAIGFASSLAVAFAMQLGLHALSRSARRTAALAATDAA